VERRRALLAAVTLVAATARCGDGPMAPGAGAAGSITAADIRHRVGLLADDSMRGRWTPSPELEEAASYVAGEFARLGLRGAGPGGEFILRYPAVGGSAPNVIGVLEGGDSGLAGEIVLVVAHMDHKGVDVPVNGDSIYNGADDNASGTAGMLEIAEAFAELNPRPRRSVAFIAFSGEERGLWGSTNYAGDPAIPLEQTVAVINLDMISRNDPGSVGVTGLDSSSLGAVFGDVARAHRELGLAALPFVDVGRSDHQPFAQRAVPYLVFFAGLHQDYHRPSDTVDRINADKAARVARLAFYAALEIASQAARPVWHGPPAR